MIRRAIFWRLLNPKYSRTREMLPTESDFKRITDGYISSIISRGELLSAGFNIASNEWLTAVTFIMSI